ncbi:MAG TPA: DUF1761 domain-containing protein [Ornithinibacter sp.]|nr:DUF1761 domain-containing protein [Ornithinibacter sp.]
MAIVALMTSALVLTPTLWLGVLVATVLTYLLGALWFTPLFGRAWDRGVGVRRERGARFGPAYYVVPLVGAAGSAYALAVLVTAADLSGVGDAVVLGVVVGLGVGLTVSFTNALTPRTARPLLYGLVTGSFHAVSAVLAAVVAALAR